MTIKIDSIAYKSELSGCSPRLKIITGLLLLITAIAFDNPFTGLSVLAVSFGLCIFAGKIKVSDWFSLMMVPIGFIIIGSLAVLVGKYPSNTEMAVSFKIGDYLYGISYKSLYSGVNLIIKSVSAVSAMYVITLNTTLTDILEQLRMWKVPGVLISLMELIYRCIFIIFERASQINTAQNSRLADAGFLTKIKASGQLCACLFLDSYVKADRIYNALLSRGYEGEFYKLEREYQKPNKTMTVFLFLAAAVFIISAGAKIIGII